jgi:anaerobic magnesium-protoporphyrin IX monomethyl ester cyclase
MAFDRVPISRVDSSSMVRILQKGLGFPARWRLDHDVYGLPVEVWINQRLKRFVSVAKPKVDAKQLEPAAAANCP